MKLHVEDDDLASCVSCGLCLPHCPTFRVTGEEGLSPRGRIATMRAINQEDRVLDADAQRFFETCVQCRGCEPACPSGVPFGRMIEGARRTLAEQRRITPRWQRAAFAVLRRHRLLLGGSSVLAIAQRLGVVPRRLGLPRLALRRAPLHTATGDDVWLYTGCVMDAWQRDTHRSTAEVLSVAGVSFRYPQQPGCCGALHEHAGLHEATVALAEATIASMPGDAPIVVNSAGCGAAMKHYGDLLGTEQGRRFAARVVDVHEYLAADAQRIDAISTAAAACGRATGSVVVHDPCHLRHVQKVHGAVRSVLRAAGAPPVELDDEGLCCGAGGAYSALQPELAGQIRDRKLAAIDRAGCGPQTPLASANPGCSMHLSAAGVEARHPIDIVADAVRRDR